MDEGSWTYYCAIFFGTASLSLVLTPLALRIALRRQILDQPAGHKAHESPVPYLGGLAIVTSFVGAVLVAAVVRPPEFGVGELRWVVAIAFGLSVLGLVDDLRALPPWTRVVFEIGAGIALWETGAGVELFRSDIANAAITIAWVVGVTNAFNLLDNMDGLSAGVATIAGGWFFVIAAANGQYLVAGLATALAGCALGFLRHNFHPARIYMGDAGSLFLGFMLAYLGIKLRFDSPMDVTFLVPVVVLGIAILDTTLVTVARLRNGRSPFQGGLDHVSHRLVFIGIPVRAAVGLLYGGALGLGVVALVVSRVDRLSAYLLAGLVFVGGAALAVLLARVPVYRGTGAWSEVDAERLAELAEGAGFEEQAGRPIRNRQGRLGSLFGRVESACERGVVPGSVSDPDEGVGYHRRR